MKILIAYLRLKIKRDSSFFLDFVAQNVNSVINAAIGLILIYLLRINISNNGSNELQLILIVYIMYSIANGYFYQIFMGFLMLPEYAISGEVNNLLLRPEMFAKTLLKKDFGLHESISILGGYIFLLFLIPLNLENIVVILLSPISGAMIMGGMAGVLSSFALKYPASGAIMYFIFPVANMGQYPISAYPKWMGFILKIIPVAFIAYYPSLYIEKQVGFLMVIICFCIGILMSTFGIIAIQFMLKKYNGPNT